MRTNVKVKKKKGENPWVTYIKRRIKRNQNFIGLFIGPTGSGKSYAKMKLGEKFGDLPIKKVCFDSLEFVTLLDEDESLGRGSVIVWEEVGVNLSAREWQTKANRLINHIMQSFRHKGYVLLMSCPAYNFLDSQTRQLLHAMFEMKGIDYKKKVSKIKAVALEPNYASSKEKVYQKYLRVKYEGKRGYQRYKIMCLGLPSDGLIAAYESKKEMFSKKLKKEVKQEMMKDKGLIKKEPTPLQQEVIDCWKDGIKKQKEIAKKLRKTQSFISQTEQLLMKKGHNKEDY